MSFEEWLSTEGYALSKNEPHYYLVREAWEAGIQEGIDRMYRLYDICPECGVAGGQHKMDCSRG
jgi:hypothetical protein